MIPMIETALVLFAAYALASIAIIINSHRLHKKQVRERAERIEAEREKMYANPYTYEFPWNKEQEK